MANAPPARREQGAPRARLMLPGRAKRRLGLGKVNNRKGIIEDDLQPGHIHLVASSKRHAPALLGPFTGEIGGKLEGLKFVMRPGFTGRVKLLGPAGEAITNAIVL